MLKKIQSSKENSDTRYLIKMNFIIKDLIDFAVFFEDHIEGLLEKNLGLTNALMNTFFKFNDEIMGKLTRAVYRTFKKSKY